MTVAHQQTGSDEAALATYRSAALDLADATRELLYIARDHDDDTSAVRLRSLLARLAEDRFNLAVMGQFSRGKSTLMNALLGAAHLPMGALPMTAVITAVQYGDRPTARIHRRRRQLPAEVAIEDLARYIAQASDERAELDVELVELEVPAELLRLGITFIDTPGVGSSIVANTATTERLLPDADAVVLVTGFDSPLTAAELEFLAAVRHHVTRVFVVINKLDLVSPAEADEVVDYVKTRLGLDDGGGQLRSVFAVSALQALEAKLAGDDERLDRSSLPHLEGALVSYLTTRKAREFLLQTVHRVRGLTARERWAFDLGRQGPSTKKARQARLQRFDDDVEDLHGQARRIAESMEERIASGWAARQATDAAVRHRDVVELLEPIVDDVVAHIDANGQRRPREVVVAAVDRLGSDGAQAIQSWAERRGRREREWAQSAAADGVRELERLRATVPTLLASRLGSAPPPDGTGVSDPIDLPELVLSRLSIEPGSLPSSIWLGRRSFGRVTETVAELVDRMAADASAAFDANVADALSRSMESLRRHVTESTNADARRLRDLASAEVAEDELRALDDLDGRLAALEQSVERWEVHVDTAGSPPAPRRPPGRRQLVECEVCRQLDRALFDYLAHEQYALSTRHAAQAAHVEAGGYCSLHTWDHVVIASEIGVATAYAGPAAQTAVRLRDASDAAATITDLADGVVALVQQPESCPACRFVAAQERAAIGDVVQRLREQPDVSPALCVSHLARALHADVDLAVAKRLVSHLSESLAVAAEDMRSYALKRESLRRHLLSRDEHRAHTSVVARLAGSIKLVHPWLPPDEL